MQSLWLHAFSWAATPQTHIKNPCLFLTKLDGSESAKMTCLYCGLSSASANWFYQGMHSHTGCICLVSLHCGFSNVSAKPLHKRMYSYNGCICLQCLFSNVISNHLPERTHSHTGCTCQTFLHCALAAFHWLFSAMCFQMGPQWFAQDIYSYVGGLSVGYILHWLSRSKYIAIYRIHSADLDHEYFGIFSTRQT